MPSNSATGATAAAASASSLSACSSRFHSGILQTGHSDFVMPGPSRVSMTHSLHHQGPSLRLLFVVRCGARRLLTRRLQADVYALCAAVMCSMKAQSSTCTVGCRTTGIDWKSVPAERMPTAIDSRMGVLKKLTAACQTTSELQPPVLHDWLDTASLGAKC